MISPMDWPCSRVKCNFPPLQASTNLSCGHLIFQYDSKFLILDYKFFFIQTSGFYSLVSKSPIPDIATTCQGVMLPYHPGFIYAAFLAEGGSQEATFTVYNSMPDFLKDHIHVMDVSTRKVMYIMPFIIKTNLLHLTGLRVPFAVCGNTGES